MAVELKLVSAHSWEFLRIPVAFWTMCCFLNFEQYRVKRKEILCSWGGRQRSGVVCTVMRDCQFLWILLGVQKKVVIALYELRNQTEASLSIWEILLFLACISAYTRGLDLFWVLICLPFLCLGTALSDSFQLFFSFILFFCWGFLLDVSFSSW